jgi:hypothetical protein
MKDEMGGSCSTEELRNAYNILVRKPEGKRPLGRSRRRWGIILAFSLGK